MLGISAADSDNHRMKHGRSEAGVGQLLGLERISVRFSVKVVIWMAGVRGHRRQGRVGAGQGAGATGGGVRV